MARKTARKMARKTDNHDPRAKLDLRRYFLRKYHGYGHPIDVLDCCQGGGLLWRTLRREFPVGTYWGLDLKPRKGRLALDSSRVLAQPGWPQNVIDIDTYGAPWKHWAALLPNLGHPTTVFLTIGQWQMGTDRRILASLGLRGMAIPPGICRQLHDFALSYMLTRSCDYGIIIIEAVEAVSTGRTRYVGIRLEPGSRKADGLGS
jgi:hypothetical protein